MPLPAAAVKPRYWTPNSPRKGACAALQVARQMLSFSGRQFLLEFAIPHFFYHVTTAYGILRKQGVPLTMGDFWGS